MASEFSVQVQGDQALLKVLADLRGRTGNLTSAWKLIGAELVSNADRRFETKTDPAGIPWAPWAPRTARLRAKQGRGTLLELTRLMRASLSSTADADGVTFGLGRSYGLFHETGTRKMVRRGMLLASVDPATLGDTDRRTVLDILMEHLHG